MGRTLPYFCIALVAVVVLVPIAIKFRHVPYYASGRYKRDVEFSYDVEQLGAVLVVFVEDHGRMPGDFQELEVKGYIVRREDGKLYPSKSIVGRPTGLAGPKPAFIGNLERISVKYGARPGEGELIAVPGASEMVRYSAEKSSAALADRLSRAPTTRASSTTSVPSPGQ